MWPVKGVVVGYDGTPDARAALDWGALESRRRGLPLTVVHARGHVAVIPGPWPGRAPGWDRDLYTVASEGAARARRVLDPASHEVSGMTCAGDPASVLLIAGMDAAMLVLGSGRRGSNPHRIGPVTWEVAQNATCPVVVLSARAPAAPEAGGHVVVGVDGSASGPAAVRFAADMAAVARGELHLVAAYRSPDEDDGEDQDDDRSAAAGLPLEDRGAAVFDTSAHRRAWEHLVEAEVAVEREYPGLSLRLEALEGHAVRVLVEAGAQAGLLVVGRHHRPAGTAEASTDVARGVLLHARCPIAVVASGN